VPAALWEPGGTSRRKEFYEEGICWLIPSKCRSVAKANHQPLDAAQMNYIVS
jgi:hypothetical protein